MTRPETSPKRRIRCGSPCTGIDSPDPLLRPPPRLREALYSPNACVSFRAIRGYRPRDYFTRRTSLGGDVKIGGLAGASAKIHAVDGYVWRPEPCACVSQISACSRFYTYRSSSNHHKHGSSSSSDEETEIARPQKCECTSQVETKSVTSDAFTMTDRNMRDQGTMVDLERSDKAVDATLTMRDVTTDTDDEFTMLYSASSKHSVRFSRMLTN